MSEGTFSYVAAGNFIRDLCVVADHILAEPRENVSSGICGQRRPRSDCADAQSDLGLHFPLTESLSTTECINGKQ